MQTGAETGKFEICMISSSIAGDICNVARFTTYILISISENKNINKRK